MKKMIQVLMTLVLGFSFLQADNDSIARGLRYLPKIYIKKNKKDDKKNKSIRNRNVKSVLFNLDDHFDSQSRKGGKAQKLSTSKSKKLMNDFIGDLMAVGSSYEDLLKDSTLRQVWIDADTNDIVDLLVDKGYIQKNGDINSAAYPEVAKLLALTQGFLGFFGDQELAIKSELITDKINALSNRLKGASKKLDEKNIEVELRRIASELNALFKKNKPINDIKADVDQLAVEYVKVWDSDNPIENASLKSAAAEVDRLMKIFDDDNALDKNRMFKVAKGELQSAVTDLTAILSFKGSIDNVEDDLNEVKRYVQTIVDFYKAKKIDVKTDTTENLNEVYDQVVKLIKDLEKKIKEKKEFKDKTALVKTLIAVLKADKQQGYTKVLDKDSGPMIKAFIAFKPEIWYSLFVDEVLKRDGSLDKEYEGSSLQLFLNSLGVNDDANKQAQLLCENHPEWFDEGTDLEFKGDLLFTRVRDLSLLLKDELIKRKNKLKE
ncbi:hypothetical protein COB28_01930 [Candidatus Dependentiae bacterium]|nr:MAG: hypothetical protein COB28_01930 [Candidatus Dependentiae bacterium]